LTLHGLAGACRTRRERRRRITARATGQHGQRSRCAERDGEGTKNGHRVRCRSTPSGLLPGKYRPSTASTAEPKVFRGSPPRQLSSCDLSRRRNASQSWKPRLSLLGPTRVIDNASAGSCGEGSRSCDTRCPFGPSGFLPYRAGVAQVLCAAPERAQPPKL
jgi:hypothetical protein